MVCSLGGLGLAHYFLKTIFLRGAQRRNNILFVNKKSLNFFAGFLKPNFAAVFTEILEEIFSKKNLLKYASQRIVKLLF